MSTESDRWADLKALIAEWARPLTADDGYTAEELDIVEEMTAPLPSVLREWYQLAGRFERVTQVHDRMTLPENLAIGTGHMVIWSENQGVVYYAIDEGDLRQDDPMVWMIVPADEGEEFHSLDVPLSRFLLDMVAFQLFCGANAVGQAPDAEKLVSTHFDRVPNLGAEWASAAYFKANDALIAVSGQEIYLLAHSEKAIEAIGNAIGVTFDIFDVTDGIEEAGA